MEPLIIDCVRTGVVIHIPCVLIGVFMASKVLYINMPRYISEVLGQLKDRNYWLENFHIVIRLLNAVHIKADIKCKLPKAKQPIADDLYRLFLIADTFDADRVCMWWVKRHDVTGEEFILLCSWLVVRDDQEANTSSTDVIKLILP
jgi:hypothetical protein